MFKDREEAGNRLLEKLKSYKNKKDTVILAIPRGGVVLGSVISKGLNLPLDIVVLRKIGHPDNPEFAVGAVSPDGKVFTDPEVTIDPQYLKDKSEEELEEIKRRIKEYRGNRGEINIKDKTVLLVDDGVATGLTTLKAIDFIKSKGVKEIVLAIPVISRDTALEIKDKIDELIYIETPELFFSVGQFYESFSQVEDSEVKELLESKKA